jgi:predicted nucleotidyltransferase
MIFFTMFDPRSNEVRALCRRYGVRRLELFGSATTGAFDPQRSDVDAAEDAEAA